MGLKKYVSDIIVDVLKSLDIEYVALNPGATFRGLQDSIVNYGGNCVPEVIECCHEEIAVGIAHGYAKAKGRPMACLLHDVVGLLHASMAIFNAWCDNVPIILLGGTGPMAVEKRRPWIDWVHTALVQGNLIRDYTKWDDQPFSEESIPESLIRAYRIAMTDPKGPVYVCFDAELQEKEVSDDLSLQDVKRYPAPTPAQAHLDSLKQVAKILLDANMPVVIADFLGRNPAAVDRLVELAETVACPVVDLGSRMNFPNTHPMDIMDRSILSSADVILALDVKDLYGALTKTDRLTRRSEYIINDDVRIISMGLFHTYIKSTITDFQRLQFTDMTITCDTSVALPKLIEECKENLRARKEVIEDRFDKVKAMHDDERNRWGEAVKREWGRRPISLPRLAYEVWHSIKDEDWVLASGGIGGHPSWERRIWEITRPYQYFGHSWGGGLGYCLPAAIGVALAMRDSGRLLIDLQPDGDLLYTCSALWTAAHHRVPLLVVMVNNRRYQNDWQHSYDIAVARGRRTDTVRIGNELDDPPPDFATLARSLGCYGIGPVEDPDDVGPAIRRAIEVVKKEKKLALVDVVTQPR